ncbi:Acetamidase/Formamidase [Thozetella sp. PMI_491]|nr:Acetamidase/Formamidase [Thozetella sp. PMI_491]
MSHSFHVHSSHAHLRWSQSIPPVLRVASGSEVSFDLLDGGNNQIRPDNEATALAAMDFSVADPAVGPVYVEEAEPGDVLKVEFLELKHADYGWTAVFPSSLEFGLLADEFPTGHLKIWDLSDAALLPPLGPGGPRRAVFKPGITVPIRPFLGVVGVAPNVAEELPTIPPYAASGGNMDCRYLSQVGSVLYLPVNVPGALLSAGDGHAAQGDGEVCGTAIETPMKARLRLTVEKKATREVKGYALACPHYTTAPRTRAEIEAEIASDKGEYAALGIHENIREASRMALRGLLDWLVAEKGLTRVEAYMLASVSATLKMAEVVDMPNYGIACSLPLSVFDE